MSFENAVSLFRDIRPKCIQLAQIVLSDENKSGSLELLNGLKDLHLTLESEVTNLVQQNGGSLFLPLNLSEYIMVPITTILKNDTITDSELEHVLGIVHILLKYSFCQPGSLSIDLFTQYITLLTYLVGGKPGQFLIKAHSDETYLICILCIDALIHGAIQQSPVFIETILDNIKFIPTLGFLVSVLLNIAVESATADIKRQSLNTLNTLFYLLNDGEILSLFFPGTVSSIAKIIKSNSRSVVVEESFRVLTNIVTIVFSDFNLGIEVEKQELNFDRLKQNVEEGSEFREVEPHQSSLIIKISEDLATGKRHRTQSWLDQTIIQFEKALKIILKIDLDRYSKYSVKDAIYQFDVKLIRNCMFSCQKVLPITLKSLSEVSSVDFSLMKEAIDSLVNITDLQVLRKIVEELLLKELEMMQYNFLSPDPLKIELMLQHINFLISFLNSSGGTDTAIVEKLVFQLQENIAHLCTSKHMPKSKSVFQPEFQPAMETQLKLVSAQYDSKIISDVVDVEIFNGILTKKCEKLLLNLLKTLSNNFQEIPIIEYALTENVSINMKNSIQLWMYSIILSNVTKETRFVMDDFLDFDESREDIQLNATSGSENQIAITNKVYDMLEMSIEVLKQTSSINDELQATGVTSVMCLRSIHNAMKVLKDDFEEELIDVIYPIVECLASGNENIRTEAQVVALDISKLFYCGSIEKLIFENSDYLLDALSSKLTGELLTPKTPILLSILVKLGSMDLVAELDDIVRTLFTLLDIYSHYPTLCEGFFLVFNEIIAKIYQELSDYDFEALASQLEEDSVLTFDIWGLKSPEEVADFVKKKSVSFEDLAEDSDEEIEEIKHGKILEIDSDDSDNDSDNESDLKSRSSYYSESRNNSDDDGDDGDEDAWISPLKPKLYSMLSNILAYAERLAQTNHNLLTIALLKTIKRIIPLLATQNNKFLPIAVSVWELMVFLINEKEDLRIIGLCTEICQELIKFGSTFFTTRFVEFYKDTKKNSLIQSLILKQMEILKQRSEMEDETKKVVVNPTSTSTNWELETFIKICHLLLFSLQKLGRFIPTEVAVSMIKLTIYFDNNVEHYGYFDDLAKFLIDNKEIM